MTSSSRVSMTATWTQLKIHGRVRGQRYGSKSQSDGVETHQVVQLRVLAEERVPLLLLTADKVLDVHVEAGGGDAVGAERGLLTLLEEQRQQREERMSAPTNSSHQQRQRG